MYQQANALYWGAGWWLRYLGRSRRVASLIWRAIQISNVFDSDLTWRLEDKTFDSNVFECQRHNGKFVHVRLSVSTMVRRCSCVLGAAWFSTSLRSWRVASLTHRTCFTKATFCLLWIDEAKANIKPIYECRCNGRLQSKRSTPLSHTGLVVELEDLKIKTRLTTERFPSVKGECEI